MNQEQVEAEVTRVVASIKLPVALSAFDLRAFYHKVWLNGGYVQCLRTKGVLEKIVQECGGLASSSKKMRKLYEGHFCALDVKRIATAFVLTEGERLAALEDMVGLMDFWLDYDGADGKKGFDVVEEIWLGLGENAEKLVGVLVGILGSAQEETQKEQALRMVQELSYEHEDFARALVKSHSRVLTKMAQTGSERVQALACKALQNVSWWKDHAKPLIEAGALAVLAKLLETENVHGRTKTAAASALANITDHDVKHCQALLAIKKIDFWLQLVLQGAGAGAQTVAALHVIESLAKNVPALRSRGIPQLQGVELLCRLLQESDQEDLCTAAVDCLEEVCRAVPANLALAQQLLQVGTLQEALSRKLSNGSQASQNSRKRARGGRADDNGDDYTSSGGAAATTSNGKRSRGDDEEGAADKPPHQWENANPLIPAVNLRELNVSERDVARLTGSKVVADVKGNAVLELVMGRVKQERLEHTNTKQSLATLQQVLRAALQALAEGVRGGQSVAVLTDNFVATIAAKAVDTSFIAHELEELSKLKKK